MQFPQIVLRALIKIVDSDGIMSVAAGADVNYRTIRSAKDTGEAKPEQYEKILAYVLKRTEEKKKENRKLAEKLK